MSTTWAGWQPQENTPELDMIFKILPMALQNELDIERATKLAKIQEAQDQWRKDLEYAKLAQEGVHQGIMQRRAGEANTLAAMRGEEDLALRKRALGVRELANMDAEKRHQRDMEQRAKLAAHAQTEQDYRQARAEAVKARESLRHLTVARAKLAAALKANGGQPIPDAGGNMIGDDTLDKIDEEIKSQTEIFNVSRDQASSFMKATNEYRMSLGMPPVSETPIFETKSEAAPNPFSAKTPAEIAAFNAGKSTKAGSTALDATGPARTGIPRLDAAGNRIMAPAALSNTPQIIAGMLTAPVGINPFMWQEMFPNKPPADPSWTGGQL